MATDTAQRAAANQGNVIGEYVLDKIVGTGDFDCRIRLCRPLSEVGKHGDAGSTQYAVKIYDKDVLSANGSGPWEVVRTSVIVMRRLPKHHNIVQMVECFETDSCLYIVMEFVDGIQLTKLYSKNPQPEQITRGLFAQLLCGIEHMHSSGFAHLGVAPDHLLVGDNLRVKIGFLMFCQAVQRGARMTVCRGTSHTIAPEILSRRPYDPMKADAWSCGIVLYFMLAGGKYPFDGANISKHILAHRLRPLPDSVSEEARGLCMALLEPDAELRLSIGDAINHSWVSEHVSGSGRTGASSSWTADGQLQITLPFGLTKETEAALVIQHAWRAISKARKDGAMSQNRRASRRDSQHQFAMETVGKEHLFDVCDSCGRRPPPRVSLDKPPYPDLKHTLRYQNNAFQKVSQPSLSGIASSAAFLTPTSTMSSAASQRKSTESPY